MDPVCLGLSAAGQSDVVPRAYEAREVAAGMHEMPRVLVGVHEYGKSSLMVVVDEIGGGPTRVKDMLS